MQFDHPDFKRGREDLLHLIVRKSAGHGVEGAESGKSVSNGKDKGGGGGEVYKDDVRQLGQQVRQLKSQYEELAKMQQRILYVFSRYVNAEQGGRRKRYVDGAADDEEGGGSGGGGGTAKKARLLIENLETRARRNEAAGTQNGTHASTDGSSRGARRGGLMSPLAEINWNDQHAMQDLIHSPYMRGAPAMLNTTPMPMELPPLQSSMQPPAHDRRTRSPHALLLTRGDEREEEKQLSLLPRIDVPPRGTARRATGKFYNAGDSPSSQSSTSTEGESDRRARTLSMSQHFADQQSDAAMLAWNTTAHVGGNGVIYAPPASLPLSPSLGAGHAPVTVDDEGVGDSGWLHGGVVKPEHDDFDLPPAAAYSYSIPSTPTLDALPALSDTTGRAHLPLAAPVVFPPSPLPLSFAPSPLPLPVLVPSVDGLPLNQPSSTTSTPTHFPMSPFLSPTAHAFKVEASRS